jgi:methylenetetrahydrofolate dehydrogenase (NADP+)/methenyltetrahydrofolate cyclohydrolase
MLFDGRTFAEDVYDDLSSRRYALPDGLALGIIACEPNAVIESFVRIKARAAERLGVQLLRVDVPAADGEEGIIEAIHELVTKTQGIIVQLPLPQSLDLGQILAAIPPTHDVDGISPNPLVLPPVARAVKTVLERHAVPMVGRNAVVIGAGRLVGAPVAKMLQEEGAEVMVVTKESGSLSLLKDADIIVSGAGEPGLIQPDMVRDGVVLIDAGTSEQGGKVRGDADPACAERCSLFTPVPGGIGPVAVAMIFENLFELAQSK